MLLMHCHLNEGQSAERRLEKAGKGQGGALWGARCLPQLPLGAPSRARSVPLYDGVVISLIASRRVSSPIGAATSVQISPFYGYRNVDACRAGVKLFVILRISAATLAHRHSARRATGNPETRNRFRVSGFPRGRAGRARGAREVVPAWFPLYDGVGSFPSGASHHQSALQPVSRFLHSIDTEMWTPVAQG